MKADEYNKHLPQFLHRTDEQLAAERERQSALKPQTFNYSETRVRYERAVTDERMARESLELLEPREKEAIAYNRLKLAEAFLELGLFNLAFKTHPDKQYSQFIKRIRDAGDEQKCGHPKTRNYAEVRDGQKVPVELPNFRLWRTVFNNSPDKFISIYVCNICRSVWKEEN